MVYGKSQNDHDTKLQLVLDRLKEWGIKLNNTKCQLRKSEIQLLGHVVNEDGVKPDVTKQINLQKCPTTN